MQVYIKREAKHIERMSVRAQYVTTDPTRNKYVKNMRGIRQIQDYLLRSADKVAVPKVANSQVDLAVEIIHRTVMAALHRCCHPSVGCVVLCCRESALPFLYMSQVQALSLFLQRSCKTARVLFLTTAATAAWT
jgi:hypothetical protein